MSPTKLTQTCLARADSPFWQRCLRRSVRLYLALDEPDLDTTALEAGLHLVEQEMAWFLVGATPTSQELETARAIIALERDALLSDRVERAALVRDCPVTQYQRLPNQLPNPPATGCWYAAA